MFDMNKVANNIKAARTKMNMTQMNLADEMGVSYQAVSNWERGNSMPDISKLPELCKILDISFEELVGERTTETDITEKLMKGKEAEVTLKEMARVGQLVEPDKIESKVNETIEKGGKIPFSVLVGLAPFMDKKTLGKMAEELADVDFGKLGAIAPFVPRKTMDSIIDRGIQNGNIDTNNIVQIAPFLSIGRIQKLAEYLIKQGQPEKLVSIAPFMGKEMFPSQLKDIDFDTNTKCENDGSCGGAETDDLDEDNVDLDDLDEDDVAELAFCAFEQGKSVDKYLDYMCEDDVAELACRALKSGKDIEVFLDYMDEDDIKEMLLQVVRK